MTAGQRLVTGWTHAFAGQAIGEGGGAPGIIQFDLSLKGSGIIKCLTPPPPQYNAYFEYVARNKVCD